MRIEWIIEPQEITQVQALVATHRNNPFVQDRIKRNLCLEKRPVERDEFWRRHVGCLLTSIRKVGPGTPFSQFMATKPFPLSLQLCSNSADVAALALAELRKADLLWRASVVSGEIATNLKFLKDHGWEHIHTHLEKVRTQSSPEIERAAANFLADNLKGFGPKQSRNLLQALGLSKYEIPIDSRITRWLNDFGFPFKLTASALGDRHYYSFVSSGFQQLAAACEVEPCVLDAVIFASYDGDGWTAENVSG